MAQDNGPPFSLTFIGLGIGFKLLVNCYGHNVYRIVIINREIREVFNLYSSESIEIAGQMDLPMKPGVYKLINTVTGMVYVGASVDVFNRVRGHRQSLNIGKGVNRKLQADYTKYGREAFHAYLIELIRDVETLHERELYWIEKLNSAYPKGYNIARITKEGNPSGGKVDWWVIFPPEGEPEFIRGLTEYANAHNLSEANLSKVASGKQIHSKGYWVRKATDEEIKEEIVIDTSKPKFKVTNYDPVGEKFITKHKGKFRVALSIGEGRFHIGIYETLQEAIKARDNALALSIEELRKYQQTKAKQRGEKKTSQFKGVSWNPAGYGRWEAHIRINSKQIQLGRFHSEEEAAEAYNWAAQLKELHGNAAYQIVLDKLNQV